jgi:UPF0755 protein
MSKRSFRVALAVVIGSVAIVLAIAGWFVHRALTYPGVAHGGRGAAVEIDIRPGMSFPQIARLLARKGVIDRPTWFRIYAMWEGDTTNVRTGHYLVKDNLTPAQVLHILITGVKDKTVRVTLPEGKNMLEDFAILSTARVADAKQLEAVARDPAFLARHGIGGASVEGYLFPDTYRFRIGEKPEAVLDRLVTHEHEVWNQLLAAHTRDAAKLEDRLHWSDRDILTMASIVEKEAVDPKERPRIAQVFINRLISPSFTPHVLATDPTIRYGCEVPLQKSTACQKWDARGRLHRLQLDDQDNPYNTYQHEGLPPGPICNPGKSAIEAVLSPDGSDDFYFVAKDARNHVFARTRKEHERNVARYQK